MANIGLGPSAKTRTLNCKKTKVPNVALGKGRVPDVGWEKVQLVRLSKVKWH